MSLVPLSPAGRGGTVSWLPATNDWYVLTGFALESHPLIVVDRMRDARPHQWARDIFQYTQDGSEDIRRLSYLSVLLAPPLSP